jgi:hypothetical protein
VLPSNGPRGRFRPSSSEMDIIDSPAKEENLSMIIHHMFRDIKFGNVSSQLAVQDFFQKIFL